MVSNKLSWNVLATCSCACVKTSSHCDSTSSNAFWTQMALDSSRLQREVPYETSSGFRNPNGLKCISLCFRFVQLWGCLMGECLKNNPSSLCFWDDADHALYDTHLHFDSKDEIHRFSNLEYLSKSLARQQQLHSLHFMYYLVSAWVVESFPQRQSAFLIAMLSERDVRRGWAFKKFSAMFASNASKIQTINKCSHLPVC